MRDSYRIPQFFNNDRQLFLIPLYQRKYAWEIKHCKRLFLDLEKIIAKNIKNHFFGSIVYMQASQHDDDLLIIDGQQRITTISLLVLAAINSVKNGIMDNSEGDRYLEKISEKYLLAPYRHGVDRKIKLRPIESDMKAYDVLFENDETQFIPSEHSGITRNYMLFCDLLKYSSLTFPQLIEAIERLVIIEIRLDSDDNPQLIFESLNSCGKDLEEADKVRNYLLMSLTNEEQESLYKKYWKKIEEYTDDQPTMFIRDYLMMKDRCLKNISELYFEFKSFDEKTNMTREDLLADMTKFAMYHMQILKAKTGDKKLDRKLWQLSNINSNVPMPFELAFMDYADNNGMSVEDKYAVFDVIENFWARRIICGKPANALSKLYITLHSEILRIVKEHKDRNIPLTVRYAELLKFILLRKKGETSSVPTDEDIEKEFPNRNIYKLPIDYKCFMFERMENADNLEGDKSIVQRMKDNVLSIEHIMPQALTTQWKSDLGSSYQQIYEEKLHTFANLTLTGYNTSYSNHSFTDKKNGYLDRKGNPVYGFKDSPLFLNSFLKTCDKWTLDEMIVRQKILLERFMHLWPMITTSYTPLEKETDTVVFGIDDKELTGREIVAFIYKGKRQTVNSWKDMLVQLCTMIYSENQTDMGYVATLNNWLHTTAQKGRVRIGEHCYVPCDNSTSTKQSIISYLFGKLNIPEISLEYELKPIQEDEVVDEENDSDA